MPEKRSSFEQGLVHECQYCLSLTVHGHWIKGCKLAAAILSMSIVHMQMTDSDWDEEGNVVCSGLEQDFLALSQRKQKLYLLQELLADIGIEA